MAHCARCSVETDLFVGEVPLCVDCSELAEQTAQQNTEAIKEARQQTADSRRMRKGAVQAQKEATAMRKAK